MRVSSTCLGIGSWIAMTFLLFGRKSQDDFWPTMVLVVIRAAVDSECPTCPHFARWNETGIAFNLIANEDDSRDIYH